MVLFEHLRVRQPPIALATFFFEVQAGAGVVAAAQGDDFLGEGAQGAEPGAECRVNHKEHGVKSRKQKWGKLKFNHKEHKDF